MGTRVSWALAVGWIVMGLAALLLVVGGIAKLLAIFVFTDVSLVGAFGPGALVMALGIALVGVAVHREHPDSLSVLSGIVSPLAYILLAISIPLGIPLLFGARGSFRVFLSGLLWIVPGVLAGLGARRLSDVARKRREASADAGD